MANYRQYTTLVSAAEVIEKTFTNKNTDPTLISENTIVLAELAHIRPLLGDKFYGELKLQHNGGTLSTNNATLMQYFLEDTLCWYVRFEVANDIMNNTTSSGIVNNIDEFSRLITPKDFNTFKQDTYRKAEIFAKDMMDYIEDEDQDGYFPTYENNKPKSMIDTYKNHGMIFYDSIYTYRKQRCGANCTSYDNVHCYCVNNC